jgi:hypothetical protein
MDLILRLSESAPPTAAFPATASIGLFAPSIPLALFRADAGQLVS